ncbi:hypothetical protein SE17_06295 [Kouleothrix aurantiaca]|uniref:NADH:quinone oxidoreductase/Mrp antiporter transmembrane domain-containing protein n=1 Tax=Kouleothrix aurantiaca TaxID=186479 RepID=A0A0N8PSY4_9CHLR|nr:hypothetical protein SE17_06295 [Kouleothrix aurantiaca]
MHLYDLNAILPGVPWLSLIWLSMLIPAVIMMFLKPEQKYAIRMVGTIFAFVSLVLSLLLFFGYDYSSAQKLQFVEELPWLPQVGISYLLGVDGISMPMLILNGFVIFTGALMSWNIEDRAREYWILLLVLTAGVYGVFVSIDLFLFFVFYELAVLPMYLLIGIWGSANRVRAATKFFLYTFAGSVFMLLGIIALYLLQPANARTFDIATLQQNVANGTLKIDPTVGRLLFASFFLAFAIKVPLWPFHTWLPLAHTEAPTAGSVILAGVMLKLGGYGLIRFNLQLFPEASRWAAPAIGVLAVIGILYGAMVSFAQTDMKKLVAYSSVSHLGFVVLGIFSLNQAGISGAIIQMINHGLSTGALFLVVGYIYERRHTREMAAFGGLWKVMPIYGGLALAMVMSSVGLPGLNGFVGEYTIMQGAYLSDALGGGFVAFAVIGVIFAATYLLRMFRLTFMGDVTNPENAALADITPREIALLALLLVPIVAIGLYPNFMFAPMQPAVEQIAQQLTAVVAAVR